MTETHLPEVADLADKPVEVAEPASKPLTDAEAREILSAVGIREKGWSRIKAAKPLHKEMVAIGVHAIGVTEHYYGNDQRDKLIQKCRKRVNKADRDDNTDELLAFAQLQRSLLRDRDEAVRSMVKTHGDDPSSRPNRSKGAAQGPMKGVAIQIVQPSKVEVKGS